MKPWPKRREATRPMGPEPIRPIVRRVVEEVGEQYPEFLIDPLVRSLCGEPVEP